MVIVYFMKLWVCENSLLISDHKTWCNGWYIDGVCHTTRKVIGDACKYFQIMFDKKDMIK